MENFITVATFTYQSEYAVLALLLEQHDIPHVFLNEPWRVFFLSTQTQLAESGYKCIKKTLSVLVKLSENLIILQK